MICAKNYKINNKKHGKDGLPNWMQRERSLL